MVTVSISHAFSFFGKKTMPAFFFGTYDACKIMPLLPAKEKKTLQMRAFSSTTVS